VLGSIPTTAIHWSIERRNIMTASHDRRLRPWRRGALGLTACIAAIAHADEGPAAAVANQAAACESCHQGALSLVGKQPADVTAMIRVIADGVGKHPPVTLALDLDDKNIVALAQALTAAD
jgi:hypothetical protein